MDCFDRVVDARQWTLLSVNLRQGSSVAVTYYRELGGIFSAHLQTTVTANRQWA